MRWACHWLGLLPPKTTCFGLRRVVPLAQGIICMGKEGALSASCLVRLRLYPPRLYCGNEQAACVAEPVCRRELLDWCDGPDLKVVGDGCSA